MHSKDIMRTIFAILVIVSCWHCGAFAQESQPTPAGSPIPEPTVDYKKWIVDPIITQADINRLPLKDSARPQQRRDSLFQRSAVAERKWPAFFKRLRAAVRRRDRVRLKEIMLPGFHYSLGHHARNQDEDFREQAFKYWDEPINDGWRALNRTLAKGAVPMASWWRKGNKEKSPPTRVSPPAANIRRNIDRNLVSHLALFEFRNGRWYFTSFDVCCD